MGLERAKTSEGTMLRERAIVGEGTMLHERATGMESTMSSERAMWCESDYFHERVKFRDGVSRPKFGVLYVRRVRCKCLGCGESLANLRITLTIREVGYGERC